MENLRKPVIMAIDNDAVILHAVLAILRSEYCVRPFTGAKAALQHLQNNTVDLILVDFNMPEMDGFEFLRQVQRNPDIRDIPVIILTGSVSDQGEVTALKMGAVDYISKPIKAAILRIRVQLQLELQRHKKHMKGLVEEKTQDLQKAYDKLKVRENIILSMLARVTDMRDHETGHHIERTTMFVKIMIQDLLENPQEGYILTPEQAEDIINSAQLHDLGKISMPDHILLKAGKITQEEFEVIKQHPQHGAQLLSEMIERLEGEGEGDAFLSIARDITYCHHEKWNGSGYPNGLWETGIPLSARIVAIADVYDALTSWRPYKEPFSHHESVDIICKNAGTQFDPYLVTVFLRHADNFQAVVKTYR